jgi:peptide/nickel transport system permease protein
VQALTASAIRAMAMMVAASILAFALLRSMPADPADVALAGWGQPLTLEARNALHTRWGIDRPLIEQYMLWTGRFVIGDWGKSFRTERPIFDEFVQRLPVSFSIGMGGLALACVLAIPLGFASAARPGGAADLATRALAIGGQSVPAFWVGLVLIWVLAVKLHWIRPFTGGVLHQMLLPTLLVATYSIGSLARVYRNELLACRSAPFFQTALAKGLTQRQALRRHGHRHAVYAMVVALTPEFGWVIGGTAVTEVVFGVPGVSQYLVDSIAARDFLVLQAYIMAMAVWMVLIHLLALAALRRIDPRP